MDIQPFSLYMDFKSPQGQPWSDRFVGQQLGRLGADHLVSAAEVEAIRWCYMAAPTFRSYHGDDHGAFVGQPHVPEPLAAAMAGTMTRTEAGAVLALAGLFHDAAYKHVDTLDETGRRAWPSTLREMIGEHAQYERTERDGKAVFVTRLTAQGQADPVTRMVAHVFQVTDEGIAHHQGGNEFDSALAAAKFLEGKNTPARFIVAVVAAIAATVPFRPALVEEDGVVSDGYMGELAQRVKTVSLTVDGERRTLDWRETDDVMLVAVQLANRDVSPFMLPNNFGQVVSGGRGVKKEEVPELRAVADNIQSLLAAASRERSAPLLYQGLGGDGGPVPAENVPHLYIPHEPTGERASVSSAYPPRPIYLQAVRETRNNTHMATLFFQSHEVGIAFAAAVATMIGEPYASVPGIVDASLWDRRSHPPAAALARLERPEVDVYRELHRGDSQTQVDALTTHRSPIAGMIFGTVRSEGVRRLSALVASLREEGRQAGLADPFADRGIASRFVHAVREAIGGGAFQTIITEMHRVARFYADDPVRGHPDRPARLEALGGPVKDYTGH